MECSDARDAAGFDLTARRNNSLSSKGRRFAFCLIFAASLSISLAFALIGAWPILPFAGLEMLFLYLAFRYMKRHEGDYERIRVIGDKVFVESVDGKRVRRQEFNRYWAQVVYEPRASDGHCHVTLRSHGRDVEFGRYLTDDQRMVVAQRLKRIFACER